MKKISILLAVVFFLLATPFLIKDHLIKFNLIKNLKNYFNLDELQNIISFMKKDKKNTTTKINLILLKKIGNVKLNLNYNDKELTSFVKKELTNQNLY